MTVYLDLDSIQEFIKAASFNGLEGNKSRVALYCFSKKTLVVKEIDLDQLKNKKNKLKSWSEEQRFVAIVEKGQGVYSAFVSPEVARTLNQSQQRLKIDGKENSQVKIIELSAGQYEDLAKISLAFNGSKDEDSGEEKQKNYSAKALSQSFFASNAHDLIVKDIQIAVIISEMVNLSNDMKNKLLRKWAESIAEEKRLDDKKDKEMKRKNRLLKNQEIEQEIFNHEIKKQIQSRQIRTKEIEKSYIYTHSSRNCNFQVK